MRGLHGLVAAVAALFLIFAHTDRAEALSRAEVVQQIVAYYNPSLAEAVPVADCVMDGGSLQSCANQVLRENEDVQRMVQVLEAYREHEYMRMVTLAGVGAACAWVELPDSVCNGVFEALSDAASAAAAAPSQVIGAVNDILEGLGDIGCTITGCSSDKFDAQAEWQRCYAPHVQEAVLRRLSGGTQWIAYMRGETAAHRFAAGTLLGVCYPFALEGEYPSGSGNEVVSAIADNFAALNQPMMQSFLNQVEQAALAAVDEPAQDYTNLQTLWAARPDPEARHALVDLLTAGPLQVSIQARAASQRADCLAHFDTAGAAILEKWVSASAPGVSASVSHGVSASSWPQMRPQVFCENYTQTFTQILQSRKSAYDQALARGCTRVQRDDPLKLQCPALGGGFQQCRTALQGLSHAQCTLIPIQFRPVPQQTPPNASETPPPATTTAPVEPQPQRPLSPLRTPGVIAPVTTPTPNVTTETPG